MDISLATYATLNWAVRKLEKKYTSTGKRLLINSTQISNIYNNHVMQIVLCVLFFVALHHYCFFSFSSAASSFFWFSSFRTRGR